MNIQSIQLSNIRSYQQQRISFPTGSLLLTGDIGSGKSTILLAIEFALFGIKPGELPGSVLLRHGTNEGEVILTFTLDNKQVVIKRGLRRTKQGVVQDPGYLIIDGVKHVATPSELRSKIFDLLGYPNEIVSKSKDLIYRYTVYTPQEAMKHILYHPSEQRLDILRRVFTVDRYKRIRDNLTVVLQSLKQHISKGEGLVADLDSKQQQYQELTEQSKRIEQSKQPLQEESVKQQAILEQQKESIKEHETKVQALQQHIRVRAELEGKLQSLIRQHKEQKNTLDQLSKEMQQTPPPSQTITIDYEQMMEAQTKKVDHLQQETDHLSRQQREYEVRKQSHLETKDQVLTLSLCSLCKQKVDDHHKHAIASTEDAQVHRLDQELQLVHTKQTQVTDQLQVQKTLLEELRTKHQQQTIQFIQQQQRIEKEQLVNTLQTRQDSVKKEIGTLNLKLHNLPVIEGMEEQQARLRKEQQKYEELSEEHTLLRIKIARLGEEYQGLLSQLKMIHEDIEHKQQTKKQLQKLRSLHSWFSQPFMDLMVTMEKQVMVRINREFNELFKTWFDVLMEDETLSVRIDDDFSPLIEQNGYETTVHHLSGGERTSAALSYRLALHHVINEVVSEIKTKDVLILDEPTDGFSTEQLDNVRQVLEGIKAHQIIMVSHEPKIESFVDHVLRIRKHEHTSGVV